MQFQKTHIFIELKEDNNYYVGTRTGKVNMFDSYKCVKKLTQQGFDENQAAAMVEVIQETRDHDISKLVTTAQFDEYKALSTAQLNEFKVDTALQFKDVQREFKDVRRELESVKIELKSDIKVVEEKLERKISDIKFDILKWIVPMFISTTGMLIALCIRMFSQ